MLGANGYPHEQEIQRIINWDLKARQDFVDLLAYIHERWRYADSGYWTETVDRNGVVFFAISTAGWSGNEDLIEALRETLLWWICFESHFRGGHYLLKLSLLNSTMSQNP